MALLVSSPKLSQDVVGGNRCRREVDQSAGRCGEAGVYDENSSKNAKNPSTPDEVLRFSVDWRVRKDDNKN